MDTHPHFTPPHTHAVVAGSDFTTVDALIGAGVDEVTVACSADALCRACEGGRTEPLLLIVDARSGATPLDAPQIRPELFEKATVVVWGALSEKTRKMFSKARFVIACAAQMSTRTMTRLALRHTSAS
jgi:hypothetical protein